ncbi:MAG: hypothetical protein HY996_10195 [Micrococcales bacterium]|nr:hypothetical protein [Micrococcales bacterium]
MRFVLAIVLFVCALASAGFGIAQRTVLAGPSSFQTSAAVDPSAPVTVVDGRTLTALPGTQSLTATGSGPVFMAYGRTADVRAWVGEARVNRFDWNAKSEKLVGRTVAGTEQRVPNPRDSDLWLEQKSGARSLEWTLALPADYSVLIASDGSSAAPADVGIRWPIDNSAPYSGLFIVAGIGLLILGLLAFVWALVHTRRTRGPRRRQPRLPRAPRPRAISPRTQRALTAGPARGRRRGFIALPVLLGGALLLSGCTNGAVNSLIGEPTVTPTPSPTDAAKAAGLPPVAVSRAQLATIVERVSATVGAADTGLDATRAAERLSGPALAERQANYLIRKADANQPADRSIPARQIQLMLPQQNASWPRTVFVVVGDPAETKTTAPVAMMLVQQSPRDQYQAQYLVSLEANVRLPALAPATVGAPRVKPDTTIFTLQPQKVGPAYYDLLLNGEQSASAKFFDLTGDQLQQELGPAKRAERKSSLPASAQLEYSRGAGDGSTIVFSTNDAGAIVATDVADVETVTPKEAGSAINPTGQVKLLSGLTQTTKGVVSTYGLQLLFYVPPAQSSEKIRVLGYASGLLSSKEVP